MKLFTVVPKSYAESSLCAVFSTYQKAYDYVERQGCTYVTNIFESDVIGNYEYPNEVFVVKIYHAYCVDGDVDDVEIFATFPKSLDLPKEYHYNIEQYIPDSQDISLC